MKKLFRGKKLLVVLPLVLALVGGGVYKVAFATAVPAPKKKIEGVVVPLEKEFLVNLAAGHYAKVSIAVVVDGAGGAHGAGEPVVLAQDAAIRAIVTDTLTGVHSERLVDRHERHALLKRILKAIKKRTDEHVEEVLVTDLTIQ